MRFGGAIFGSGGAGNPSNQSVTLTVAAVDANAQFIAAADFVCDGVDDDVQIQAALDQLTTDEGGVVQLSEGTFVLADSTGLTFDRSNVEIRGMGEATLIQASLMAGVAFFSMVDTTTRFRITIRDLRINSATADTGTGIDFSHFRVCSIFSVSISGVLIGVDINDASSFYNDIRDVDVTAGGVGSFGFVFRGGANFNTCYKCTGRGDTNTSHFRVEAIGCGFFSCDAEGTNGIGIDVQAAGDSCNIFNPWIEGLATGILIAAGAVNTLICGGEIILNTANITDNGTNTNILGSRVGGAAGDGSHCKLNRIGAGNEVLDEITAGGDINYLSTNMQFNTAGGGAADTLDNILGGTDGDLLIWRPTASGRVITVTNNNGGDGSIRMVSPAIITTSFRSQYFFICKGQPPSTVWYEISRSTPI